MTILRSVSERERSKKSEPPDGGWGWMIVLGVALSNMTNQALVSVFGLLYGDMIVSMGHGTTGAAVILNLMSAVTNLSGILIGPVIKQFSYRKAALAGGILIASGVIITSAATSMIQMIFSYSLLAGLGYGLQMPATFVAVNSYFRVHRGRAVGLAMAGTGLGQMTMPLIVRALLEEYGFRGTGLILGGLALHSLVGVALYQPVEWHLRAKEDELEAADLPIEVVPANVVITENHNHNKNQQESYSPAVKKLEATENSSKEQSLGRWGRVVQFMDLDLLRDPVFVNLVLGLALVYAAGVNFSLVFPFFLHTTAQLPLSQTAMCMSVLSGADFSSRLILPPITDRFGASNPVRSRVTFFLGAVALAITRSAIGLQRDLKVLLVVSAMCGFVRGATVVNLNLSISEYCNKEKLPSALGINMVAKGLAVLCFGPLLGWIRDKTDSYPVCIHAQSLLILLSMGSWIIERFVIKQRGKS